MSGGEWKWSDRRPISGRPALKAEVNLRLREALFFALLMVPVVAIASQRDVKLEALFSSQQTVKGVGGGGADSAPSATTSCSAPFPEDASSVTTMAPSSVSQCTFGFSAPGIMGTAQVTNVKATIRAEDGTSYYVYLSCWKQRGWCDAPKANQTYRARLNEGIEQLSDYSHRRVSSPVKVSLKPDGSKKVTYLVIFATKVPTKH